MSEQPDLSMDPNGLYREENISDHRVGSIIRMTPITADGEDDPSREVRYLGQSQMMMQSGPLPLHFEIEASSLSEAVGKFAEGAQQAAEETIERLKELQRQQASSIVVPGQDSPKIQL